MSNASTHSRKGARWALAVGSVASLMMSLDLLVVTTALRSIGDDLGGSITILQWTVTGYSLSFAALLLTGAGLGDRFGRRRMFVSGLGLFVTASAACALSPSVGVLIAARVVQGIGAALVIPVALALVNAAYADEDRGKAIGTLEGITGVALIAGPIVGGAIAGGISWEWIFWINVPVGVILIVVALSRLDESFGDDAALDIRGLALVSAGALGLVWALARGNEAGWASAEVLITLTGGALLLAWFVAWELRVREPMLPMQLFRSWTFSASVGASFLLFAAQYGSVFFLAQFMQTGLGYKPLEAGLLLVPWTAMPIIIAPLAGMLGDKIGYRHLLTGGCALNAAGLAAIALIADPGVAYGALLAALIVTGIGAAVAMPVVQAALVEAVSETEVGKAAGANNMSQELGGAFGVAILVAVFAGVGGYASAEQFTAGFAPAMGACAALALAATIVAAVMPARERTGVSEQRPGTRTEYAPGTFSWVDLMTTDLEAAKGFYAKLFGWELENRPAGDGHTYTMASRDGHIVAGLGSADGPARWNSCIAVESVDDSTEKARDAGAEVQFGPMDVGDAGRMVVLQDPSGAVVSLWQAGERLGAGLVNAHGALSWNGLQTHDVDKATDFYCEVFGWEVAPITEDAGSDRVVIRNGEQMNGGIALIPEVVGHEVPPHWLAYFAVDDMDAAIGAVTDAGGALIAGPLDIPAGQLAVVTDPQGAAFGLVTAGGLDD